MTAKSSAVSMLVKGSLFDRYDRCLNCDQSAGSPCLAWNRLGIYRRLHPMKTVHRGRAVIPKSEREAYR
jgi:hypothetical protein